MPLSDEDKAEVDKRLASFDPEEWLRWLASEYPHDRRQDYELSERYRLCADAVAKKTLGADRVQHYNPGASLQERDERSLEDQPYDANEKRVIEYLQALAPDIGGGDDPIGFLIASHNALRAERGDVQVFRQVCEEGHEWRVDQSDYCPICMGKLHQADWKGNFERMMIGHHELKEIYVAVLKARGDRIPPFHSIMDCNVERDGGQFGNQVYANRFESGGRKTCEGTIKSERVVDAVLDLLQRKK